MKYRTLKIVEIKEVKNRKERITLSPIKRNTKEFGKLKCFIK